MVSLNANGTDSVSTTTYLILKLDTHDNTLLTLDSDDVTVTNTNSNQVISVDSVDLQGAPSSENTYHITLINPNE
jgi:hypothetical protein